MLSCTFLNCLRIIGTSKSHKRANYPKEVTRILNEWLEDHLNYPYPAEDERIEL